ncbi:helix-turn-helix transcriptional regulator [Microbacteriaceae bacterium VKM Ac-2854]|nr:helix-turn-helix transcriptional regulator [Microbacteriaceae bacterium VKM Ac-2854]
MNDWPILPRDPIVQQVRAMLRTGGRGAVLTGPAGSGRSSILRLVSGTRASVLLRAGAPVEAAVSALATERSALLCVEELDALSDTELDSIGSVVAARDVAVIGTANGAGVAALLARRHWLRDLGVVPVPPLNEEEAAVLCRGRLGGPLDALTLRRLLDLSDGWPLYLREIVSTNLRDGALNRRHGFWTADALTLPAWLDGPENPLSGALPEHARSLLADVAAAGSIPVTVARERVGDAELTRLKGDGFLRTVSRAGAAGAQLEPPPERRELLASLASAPAVAFDAETELVRADGLPVADATARAERMRGDGLHRRDARLTALGTLLLALAHSDAGLPHDAEPAASEAAALFELTDDPGLAAPALAVAALARGWCGDRDGAYALRAEAERRAHEHPTSSSHRLGPPAIELELVLGRAAEAARRARTALSAHPPESTRLRTLALLARAEPNTQTATALAPGGLDRLWAEALLHGDAGTLADAARRHLDAGRALAAAELAALAAERFRSRGEDATARRIERVATLALEDAELSRPSHWPGGNGVVLTQREREIADLVAAGIETQTLAERLHLSRRTIENHLQRCYRKLGVNNRRELAAALGGAPTLRLA